MTLPVKALVTTTLTSIYTVPANMQAQINLRFVNQSAFSTKLQVAITSATTPALSDYIDYDISVPGNGILEDTGIVCAAGEKVFVKMDQSPSTISVRIHGFEENV